MTARCEYTQQHAAFEQQLLMVCAAHSLLLPPAEQVAVLARCIGVSSAFLVAKRDADRDELIEIILGNEAMTYRENMADLGGVVTR